MQIKYLKKLQETPKIGSQKIRGVSETVIKEVEVRLNIKFPETYKEFLLLAGEYGGNLQLFPGHSDLAMLSKNSQLEIMKKQVEKANLKIDHPFWVFTEGGGFQQFLFFYLDDDLINPMVHGVTYGDEEGSYIVYPLNQKFSEYMDDLVDSSILYVQRGY